jgi:hypothetical protein
MDRFLSNNARSTSAKKQQILNLVEKSSFPDMCAGMCAGIFFGRLIRRFGSTPSRRISGPSAEFISVTRLRTQTVAVSQETAFGVAPLFAPMNNPCRNQRADLRTGFFKPGT